MNACNCIILNCCFPGLCNLALWLVFKPPIFVFDCDFATFLKHSTLNHQGGGMPGKCSQMHTPTGTQLCFSSVQCIDLWIVFFHFLCFRPIFCVIIRIIRISIPQRCFQILIKVFIMQHLPLHALCRLSTTSSFSCWTWRLRRRSVGSWASFLGRTS